MDNAVNAVNKLFSKAPVADPAKEKNINEDSPGSSAPISTDQGVASSSSSAPISTDQDVDRTVDTEVAPAVEHTHLKKQHETREQTVVEKEKHQDHYHTTVQPLKDSEVLPEKHDYTQEEKHRNVNRDDGDARAKAKADLTGFESTKDQEQLETKTKEPTQVDEHVHHHLHETVVPVIEKGKSSMKIRKTSC